MQPPPVAADHRNERTDTSGTGFGVHACRFTYTLALPGGKGFEWNGVDILENLSRLIDRTENCARYIQSRSYDDGSTWGVCIEACDESFGAKYGPMVSGEIDCWANGPDPFKWRIGWHVVVGDARRIRTGEARNEFVECGYGMLFSNNGTDQNARFNTCLKLKHFWNAGIAFDGSENPADPSHHLFRFAGHFITGFSFVDAKFSGSPIRLGRGQTIALEGTESVTVGLIGDRVQISMLGQPIFQVDINTKRTHTSDGKVYPL